MNTDFMRKILNGGLIRTVDCVGYGNEEIEKISRLYNVNMQGQFKFFMSDMGRSDGGLIGDSMIQLYRPSWRVREHLLFQIDFFNQMQESNFHDYLNNPFVFSLISETQYYFVQTSIGDAVYHYDSNVEEVKKTDWDLVNFLMMLINENKGQLRRRSLGDLLEI